jgi:phosphatidylserine/phosphatidylglycerophosphate/cardiolipin synthase-like enzyme
LDETSERVHRERFRTAHNEEFVRRLYARRPEARQRYERMAAKAEASPEVMLEGALRRERAGLPRPSLHEVLLETIVRKERPVLFIKDDWLDLVNVTSFGVEAEGLVRDLNAQRAVLQPIMPLIGRIDVTEFPGSDFAGTGWFVDTDIVITNRHVAGLIARWDGRRFAFIRGVAGKPITSSLHTLHEFDDLAVDAARVFAVREVLYIEPESGPDIAFMRVDRRTDGTKLDHIAIAKTDIGDDVPVFVVGYPARASKRVIPDQELMKELYRDRYDVKRAAPGFSMGPEGRATRHDCTTLGGNSGSVVLHLKTGQSVGLHFAGLYQEANYAVPASVLAEYVNKKRWKHVVIETHPRRTLPKPKPQSPPQRPTPQSAGPSSGAVTVTIPLSITVSLGQPVDSTALSVSPAPGLGAGLASAPADPVAAEGAVRAFWDERPDGVIAARVGFFDEGDAIGDRPYIAASVPADRLDEVEAGGPAEFHGFDVRYLAANITEQIEGLALVEAVDSISYDDDARSGHGFSFDPVEEAMTVRAHVGPEYSWDELNGFLSGAQESLVSAIYEFHAPQIKEAIEARLKDGVTLRLVCDNVTFSEVRDEDEEFDRVAVFERWRKKFKNRFKRVVAPEGRAGLISDAYHIKVTVREDDTFWLSSGNWKKGSSQPVITEDQRDNAADEDLPGNREWHVIIKNETLASRFRNHILQDFKRSRDLGGGELPKSKEAADIFIDVPIEEAVALERPPTSHLLKPRQFERTVRVKPLLTPDREGAVYSEAVLELIRSARKSLLFQIPYIGMPSNPRMDRGYIDELIKALTQKLKILDDARVILRSGGSKFSAPTHTAWFLKSKGVDINGRLRQIGDHHTKGMIVDGKRVLIGSHNWSKPGVSLNRDASLIFDDADIAAYFGEAFEIDWKRSSPITPRRFMKKEAVVQEAVGAAPPPGFRRMRLSELLKEDD